MAKDLEARFSQSGRSLIAPEYLLYASILRILYTIPSEWVHIEEIEFDILLRWFVGLGIDASIRTTRQS